MRKFEEIYPDVSFERSHVICNENGCQFYFPFQNDFVGANV